MSSTSPDSPDFDPSGSDSNSSAPGAPQWTPPAEKAAGDASAAERFRESVQSRQGDEDETESELWEGRYSSKAMIGNWILAAVITIGLLVGMSAIWGFPSATLWLIWLGITVVIWGGLWFYLLYRQWGRKYRLTTQRFIHETGILKRVTDRIEVIDVDDVTFEQKFIERFVGVGSIQIISSDRSHPELWLRGIENVKEVAGIIDDVRRKERRRRGLHIESI
jgi:uncharacterized membrane protein YdbT with pleckstrin-like domain